MNARVKSDTGVLDWEWANIARFNQGELNTAELGMSNLEKAMENPSLLSEVAEWLRQDSEGRTRLIKMMADKDFQQQAGDVSEQLKEDGALPNLLNLEYYGQGQEDASSPAAKTILSQAKEAEAAFITPARYSRAKALSRSNVQMEDQRTAMGSSTNFVGKGQAFEDLKTLAEETFPAAGYFDPLKLATYEFWGQSNEATIGFLRHAEIKHGRVAMAAFVGYCLSENGVHFPWAPFNDPKYVGLSAPALWEAFPQEARNQIILTIGFFEIWSEASYVLKQEGQNHYMRGGKPGYYPTFKEFSSSIHPVPVNLWDPFGYAARLTDAQKATKLKAELNNGRLAMIGFISLLSAAKIPGSVPFLADRLKPYDGNILKDPWGYVQ
jgi:hypothetical protein